GSQTSSLFTTFDDESSQSTFETAINEGQVIGQIPPGPPENRIDQTIENAVLNKDVKQDLPPPPPPPVEEPPPPPL
ncbi:MAG: hypothetical protein SFY92_05285, partial [Verrucomicrobiae bacterium]|nr:hypothetical protein [Verrucomicrobiae bacterium]